MAFPTDIASNSPAKYLFKLISDTETIICDIEPIGWDGGSLEIKRDLKVGGVFVSSSADYITFVGNGAKMLRDLYNTYELNAKCTLVQYWWKEFDFVDPSQGRKYVEFPTRYNIDFNFYQIVKVGGFAFGVKVKAINDSVQTKFDQRNDIDVDLNKLVSIGEFAITDYSGLKKEIYYSATNIHNYAGLSLTLVYTEIPNNPGFFFPNHINYDLPRVSGSNCYASIPLTIISNDFIVEINSVEFMNRVINITNIPKLLNNSEFDRTLIFKYNLLFNVTKKHTGTPPWTIQLIISDLADSIFTVTELGTFGNDLGEITFDSETTIDLKKGESIRFVVRTGNIEDIKAFLNEASISFTQEIAASPARTVEGFPIYEAFERVCQHIFDAQFPFYSDFFGRTDVKYSNNNNYTSENQLTFSHIQSGLHLRGLTLEKMSLPINFTDLFKTASAIYNLGYSFETISGNLRLRIEEYAHFFQNTEIVLSPTLKSRINKYDIESQVMIEFAPVDIKSGFEKFEYLQINGRAEPNTTSQRTTILNTATKFDNVAKYRGDTKGILESLNTPIDTTDTKQDSDIFITKSQWFDGNKTKWKPEKSENIAIVDDTSIFREDLLNRYFTPSRMLKRQANRIKSALTKDIFTSSYLRFQTSDKLQTLKTTGEGYTITENQDISVSELSNPIFKPMKHKINCVFTHSDLEILQANLFGWLDFGTVTGYLIDFNMENNSDKAEITIIERFIPLPD